MTDAPIISLRGITNRFGTVTVHENLDLDVRPGEVLGLIGGSGSGKSVLLRTILGLRRPQAGDVRVLGVDITHSDEAARRAVRRQWGVLFQDGALFSSLPVIENIKVPLREFTNLPPETMDDVAALKLRMVGLAPEAALKYPSELSGGMRKRAGLARALVMDPAVVFLDEPTAGLDPIGAAAFDALIADLRDALGLTVVMITHDLDSLYAVCDRVAVLAEKRIYAVGTIQELLRVDHPWLREYFTGPRGRVAAGVSGPTDRDASGVPRDADRGAHAGQPPAQGR
uniref:ABC transporter related n=1 Tax=Nitratidesulfovibrio vulgaris (strain DSM 19637 / Miyazaki F) TaxID=883 RepID=B8DLS6_NITV9